MYKAISQDMLSFIEQSPSCYHAVENLGRMLDGAGFERLPESGRWDLKAGSSYYVTRNGSALLGFRIPEQVQGGFMIAAAHSDAPALKLKANPELADEHYVRLNVEKYGGAILATWLDRPLSLAGRVTVLQEDTVKTRLVHFDRDLALIPNLAIHMNRQMNDGVALNPQIDMLPVIGQAEAVGKAEAEKGDAGKGDAGKGDAGGTENTEAGTGGVFKKLLAEAAGAAQEEVLDFDLFLYLREKGRIWGAGEEYISSPRLDDLQCAWACVKGLIETKEPKGIPVCAIFDNEEVGSGTRQGADSDFLQHVLERIGTCLGYDIQQYQAVLASSLMASVDNGHAIHPNHPEKADVNNHPHINGGIVIKYSANQKYTTDAVSAGLFKVLCRRAGVPVQVYVNRSDVVGGSTLGNLSGTHVSLRTVDIGLAQLAMHSALETGGVRDTAYLLEALQALYHAAVVCGEDGEYRILY